MFFLAENSCGKFIIHDKMYGCFKKGKISDYYVWINPMDSSMTVVWFSNTKIHFQVNSIGVAISNNSFFFLILVECWFDLIWFE